MTTWNTSNNTWNSATYTWNEVELIAEAAAVASGGGTAALQNWKKEKKKKLVKLIFRYKGVDNESSKEVTNYKITVEDVQLLTEDVKAKIATITF